MICDSLELKSRDSSENVRKSVMSRRQRANARANRAHDKGEKAKKIKEIKRNEGEILTFDEMSVSVGDDSCNERIRKTKKKDEKKRNEFFCRIWKLKETKIWRIEKSSEWKAKHGKCNDWVCSEQLDAVWQKARIRRNEKNKKK